MSLEGQKPTLQSDRRMSALPPEADIRVTHRQVCFGPQANQQRLSLRAAGSPHDRAASATLATVKTSAAICESPSGSCSAIAETTTPITGTSIVPIAATEAGRRSTAPNQVT